MPGTGRGFQSAGGREAKGTASVDEAEDIVWIEEASKELEQEPSKLEFLEEAQLA